MSELTCGNCPKVSFDPSQKWSVVGCGETGYVIPHHCDYQQEKVTFWRVPDFCPRPSVEVTKSEEQAPNNEWVIKSFSEF